MARMLRFVMVIGLRVSRGRGDEEWTPLF